MDIINPNLNDYLLNIAPERDSVLTEMEQYAKERNFPIIGPLCGKLLFILARSINAKRILELGSGYGYSAYWFGKATADDATITCTEGSPDNAKLAMQYLKRGKIDGKVTFLTGDALELMDTVQGMFDIILIDIDKHQYPQAFQKSLPRLRQGGLLIADNALRSGKIIEPHPDKNTAGILTYNRLANSNDGLATTIIPLRDGVSVSVKL